MKWGLDLCPTVLERVVLTQVSAVITKASQSLKRCIRLPDPLSILHGNLESSQTACDSERLIVLP